jgi:hypothetical protein
MRRCIQRFAVIAPFVLFALLPAAAKAQLGDANPLNVPDAAGLRKPAVQAPREAPPPALPGASSSAKPAPAQQSPTDMEPTEALFDAINRGDIAVARDAISRGADLNGRNVLGMTPMELSVDLGRNDISFLLLSMRGGDSRRTPAPVVAAAKPGASKVTRASAPARSAPAQQTPRLFANDGGTPVPSAGFLGFDSTRR